MSELSERAELEPRGRIDSLATAISVLLVMTVVQRAVGLGRNLLFCRLLDPEQLGQWNLAFSVIVLAAPLLVLGLPGSFGRYVEYHRQRGTLQVYLRRTLVATMALTVGGVALFVLFLRPTAWFIFGQTDQLSFALLVLVSLIPIVTFNVTVELATALRQVRLLSVLQLINSLLFADIGMALLYFYEATAMAVVWAYAAACVVSVAVAAKPLLVTVKSFRDKAASLPSQRLFWAHLAPFAGWIWFSNLASNLFGAIDRTMIVHFGGVDATTAANLIGQYHSSRVIPELIVSVATLLAGVMLPYMTSDWERGDRPAVSRQINRVLKLFSIASCLGSFLFLAISPWLFDHILQGKYAIGMSVVPIALACCIWSGQLMLVQGYLMCAERAGRITLYLLLGLAANVGCNLLLLPHLGLAGAALSAAIANGLSLVLTLIGCHQYGLQLERGTVLLLILPVALIGGGWTAVVVGGLTLGVGIAAGAIVSPADRATLIDVWSRRFRPVKVGG